MNKEHLDKSKKRPIKFDEETKKEIIKRLNKLKKRCK